MNQVYEDRIDTSICVAHTHLEGPAGIKDVAYNYKTKDCP